MPVALAPASGVVAMRRSFVCLLACLLPVVGLATDSDERVFIPYDPYDPSKRAAIKEEAMQRGGCGEAFIDAMLDHAEQTGYLFSIEAVSKSVPSILNSDELNIGCPGRTMRMEFLSVMSSNTIMVHEMTCEHQVDGMLCTPPIESTRYFYGDPRKTIQLSDNVSYADTMKILDWFQGDAGDLLSDEEKARFPNLAWRLAIVREGDNYSFQIGEPDCECVFKASLVIPDIAALEPQVTMTERRFACPGTH